MRSELSIKPNDNPVLVIDFSVMVYHIMDVFFGKNPDENSFLNKEQQKIIPLLVDWIQHMAWLKGRNTPKQVNPIWVKDGKPYWRNFFVTDYKGNRGIKPGVWHEIAKEVDQHIKNTLVFTGYEADDIAAGLVQIWKKQNYQGNLYLLTCDTDWLGLVSNERMPFRVKWISTFDYLPRIRGVFEATNWLNKKVKRSRKAIREKYTDVNQIRQIWDWKSEVGDKSDNLLPGSDLSLIDLLEPHEDFRIWELMEDTLVGALKQQPVKINLNRNKAISMKIARCGYNYPFVSIPSALS